MKSMKEEGAEEIRRLRKRTIRSLAMGRIKEADCRFITDRCDQIESRIQQMWEHDPGEEEFHG
jgi:hypothetical protein